MPDCLFRIGRIVADLIGVGILGFALYAWTELRRRVKRQGELAAHVRKYYEERKSVIEGREVL